MKASKSAVGFCRRLGGAQGSSGIQRHPRRQARADLVWSGQVQTSATTSVTGWLKPQNRCPNHKPYATCRVIFRCGRDLEIRSNLKLAQGHPTSPASAHYTLMVRVMQVITKPLRLALHPTDDSAVCAVSKRTFDITYSDRVTAGLEISVIASCAPSHCSLLEPGAHELPVLHITCLCPHRSPQLVDE